VEITAALAADLAILTQALDEPDADIAATLRHPVRGNSGRVRRSGR
jgi:glutamate-1-semialdehyde aminotransferase